MNQKDYGRFVKAYNWLALQLANGGVPETLSKEKLTSDFAALRNLSITTLENAVRTYYANATYRNFPLPGEIRKAAGGRNASDVPQLPQETCAKVPPHLKEQYTKDAESVMKSVDKVSTEELRYQMDLMEKAYPGLGWGECAEQMEVKCVELREYWKGFYERLSRERAERAIGM